MRQKASEHYSAWAHTLLLSRHDISNLSHCVVQMIFTINHHIVKGIKRLHLAPGHRQPLLHLIGRLSATPLQTVVQLIEAARRQKDKNGIRCQPLDRRGALHVDAQNHITTALERLDHFTFGDAFVMPINFGPLQQLATRDHLFEARLADEMVIVAVALTRPLGPKVPPAAAVRAGHRVGDCDSRPSSPLSCVRAIITFCHRRYTMYFDALTLAAVADELEDTILGGRIQRVLLTTPLSVALEIYARGRRSHLLLSAHPQFTRVHLSATKPSRGAERDTPLLLLLRKYVVGGRIAEIEQPELERVLVLRIVKGPQARNIANHQATDQPD